MLDAIRSDAPISRAEISRRAGISKPTVSLALQSLLTAGLVRETEAAPGRPSYGAVYFEPVPEAALVLGLRPRGALPARRAQRPGRPRAGASGRRARRRRRRRGGRRDRGALLGAARRVRARRRARRRRRRRRAGVVEADGATVRLAENVPGLEGRPFGGELAARLGLPVTLENDINLAALGEQRAGVARGVDDFAFLSVGTGMGAGIVLGGELHRGRHGAAGEVDFALGGARPDADPSAPAVCRARRAAGLRERSTRARAAVRPARGVRGRSSRRRGRALGRGRDRAPDRAPRRAAGGGRGRRARRPRRRRGRERRPPARAGARAARASGLPYPPRVEVSGLADAAVLTGALAVGLRAALDSVFVNRAVPGLSAPSLVVAGLPEEPADDAEDRERHHDREHQNGLERHVPSLRVSDLTRARRSPWTRERLP